MKFLWIFDADGVLLLIPAVSFLWAAGGTGLKLFRKFGVPSIISLSAFSLGDNLGLCAVACVSMYFFFSVPYGSGSKKLYWVWLYVVGAIYAASFWPLAGSFLMIHQRWGEYLFGVLLSSLTFGLLTFGSQKFDFPHWKWVEMALGACLGLHAALLI